MHRSQGEIEAAVCDAVTRFQQEYMGRGPQNVHAHLIDNRVFVHLEGVLTAAEKRLLDGSGPGNGRGADLLKQLRNHLVIAGRPVLEALVRDAAGDSMGRTPPATDWERDDGRLSVVGE